MHVLGAAPSWVYVLLVVLVGLGVRRLRTREVPVAVALIPSIAFLIWSLVGAHVASTVIGGGTAALTWVAGAAVGAASAFLASEPRATLLADGRVRQPGTPLPLVLYLAVFVIRFACGAWGAMRPEHAAIATAIGLAAGAAMTGRLVAGVSRWRRGANATRRLA